METKPVEELYDLKNDPYEVKNLANDPDHRKRLSKMRKALTQWQWETGDKGFIPERDLIGMFWPDMIQPQTASVSFSPLKNNMIKLVSATEGSSIGYQIGEAIGSNHWQLYHQPITLKRNVKIVARAIKIGFKASVVSTNIN
jgi:hypothetical protein